MTFDEIMTFTRTVSSATAFEDEECHAYYDILNGLNPGSLIVEIGLEFGRSSSVALQVAKAKHLRYCGIDPFRDTPDAYEAWIKMARSIDWPFELHVMKSHDSRRGESIDAILIDGDHNYEAVALDCFNFMPSVANGGYAMFHDFGRDSLPDVYKAVTEYFDSRPHWNHRGTVGTLGIWQRT